MSSDDLQRIIGQMQANHENMTKRLARVESAFIIIGAGAVGMVVAGVLKNAGIW